MYDISSLSNPKLIATLTVDGDVLDARLVGTQVRVATAWSPDVDAPSPVYAPDGGVSQESKDELRAAVAKTNVDDWIPGSALRVVRACRWVRDLLWNAPISLVPRRFRGSTRWRCLRSIWGRLCSPGRPWGSSPAGGGSWTDTSTYVSTTDWSRDDRRNDELAQVRHRTIGCTTYKGSGEIPGTLLNQYAMSEYNGVLRVASTVSERRGWVNSRQATEGLVTTLHEQGGALRQLGQVGGLGGRTTNRSERCDSSRSAGMS